MLEMKVEIKDRIMSHDKPIIAALYNSTYNQVLEEGSLLCNNFYKCFVKQVFVTCI